MFAIIFKSECGVYTTLQSERLIPIWSKQNIVDVYGVLLSLEWEAMMNSEEKLWKLSEKGPCPGAKAAFYAIVESRAGCLLTDCGDLFDSVLAGCGGGAGITRGYLYLLARKYRRGDTFDH